jgi:uncharacterized protein YbjT (DUF2867 family)
MVESKSVTVVGATGLIGRQLVPMLTAAGHDVTEVSRATGVDVLTGTGLDKAVHGAAAVIDVINSASPDDSSEAFFTQASSNLAAAVTKAGVGHYVVLSIVGADRLAPLAGYMRGKIAQEVAAAESGVPWTVVRATQFHELAEPITESMITADEVRVPDAMIQTVDSAEVTAILARAVDGTALNAIHEVGGPQKMPFADMARAVLTHQRRALEVVVDPSATYNGLPVDNSTLVTGDDAELGAQRLVDWLAGR